MKTQEIIKALRSTPSRSKKVLLDEAADRLEQLQKEKEALVADLKSWKKQEKCVSSVAIAALEENQSISRATIIWNTVHPAMRVTAISSGGERRRKRPTPVCWRNSHEK